MSGKEEKKEAKTPVKGKRRAKLDDPVVKKHKKVKTVMDKSRAAYTKKICKILDRAVDEFLDLGGGEDEEATKILAEISLTKTSLSKMDTSHVLYRLLDLDVWGFRDQGNYVVSQQRTDVINRVFDAVLGATKKEDLDLGHVLDACKSNRPRLATELIEKGAPCFSELTEDSCLSTLFCAHATRGERCQIPVLFGPGFVDLLRAILKRTPAEYLFYHDTRNERYPIVHFAEYCLSRVSGLTLLNVFIEHLDKGLDLTESGPSTSLHYVDLSDAEVAESRKWPWFTIGDRMMRFYDDWGYDNKCMCGPFCHNLAPHFADACRGPNPIKSKVEECHQKTFEALKTVGSLNKWGKFQPSIAVALLPLIMAYGDWNRASYDVTEKGRIEALNPMQQCEQHGCKEWYRANEYCKNTCVMCDAHKTASSACDCCKLCKNSDCTCCPVCDDVNIDNCGCCQECEKQEDECECCPICCSTTDKNTCGCCRTCERLKSDCICCKGCGICVLCVRGVLAAHSR